MRYLLLLMAAAAALQAADCSKTSTGLSPLDATFYLSPFPDAGGGLYPGGANQRPPAHEAAGLAQAALVRPRNAAGEIDEAAGRIVFLSVGMSNTTQEFRAFYKLAQTDAERSPRVAIVDGAQGGWTAARILDDPDTFFSTVTSRLTANGVTAAQVQTAWMKEADASPTLPFPQYPQVLDAEMQGVARELRKRFPNLRLLYLSSRTYGGYASTALNPEPYAYESGFAVKWMIESQIFGDPQLSFTNGVVPWMSWGPYLWADGLTQREDGLTWSCAEFEDDGTHPGPAAEEKVARMLLNFLHTDTTARTWYRRARNQQPAPPKIAAILNGASGSKLLAPRTIGTIFGSGLALATMSAATIPLPTALAGTEVLVDGTPAYLYYVSPTQINFVMPAGISPASSIQVELEGIASDAAQLDPHLYAPGIFEANGMAAALHADYRLVNKAAPAHPGETVLLFGTGLGVRNPLSARPDFLPVVRIGNQAAMVTYSGPAPGFPGMDQINVVVPESLDSGAAPLVMQVAAETSNFTNLAVGR